MFEPMVEIPKRPCPPTKPDNFAGVDFVYETPSSLTIDAAFKAGKGRFAQNGGVQNKAASFRLGYVISAQDQSTFVGDKIGHTYGLLGLSDATIGTGVKAFQW